MTEPSSRAARRTASGAPGERWIQFQASRPAAADLVRFHTSEKVSLLARSRVLYDLLGRLVAGVERGSFEERVRRYGELYTEAMSIAPTRSGHTDALQHLAGRLKRLIPADDRADLARLITGYRAGELPLEAPLERLRRHFGVHPDEWAAAQSYLHPDPGEPEPRGDA